MAMLTTILLTTIINFYITVIVFRYLNNIFNFFMAKNKIRSVIDTLLYMSIIIQ